jgi:hypothetical protein
MFSIDSNHSQWKLLKDTLNEAQDLKKLHPLHGKLYKTGWKTTWAIKILRYLEKTFAKWHLIDKQNSKYEIITQVLTARENGIIEGEKSEIEAILKIYNILSKKYHNQPLIPKIVKIQKLLKKASKKPAFEEKNGKIQDLIFNQNRGDCPPRQIETPDISNTVEVRMLQSIRLEPEGLLAQAKKVLNNQNLANTTMWIEIKPVDRKKLFNHFHIDEKTIDLSQVFTLGSFLRLVKQQKREGLSTESGIKVICDLLMDVANRMSDTSKTLLMTIHSRIQYFLINVLPEIRAIRTLKTNHEKRTAANKIAKAIIANAKKPGRNYVGEYLCLGWPGHHVNSELQVPYSDGKFKLIIPNAGLGVNHHRPCFQQLDERAEQIPDHYHVINIYEGNEAAIYEALTDLLLLRAEKKEESTRDFPSEFYNALNKHLNRIEDLSIPGRPIQTVGNCTLRNQEEAIFYICQRENEVACANTILDRIEEIGKENAHRLYPALRDLVLERPQKEKIQPLSKKNGQLVLEDGNDETLYLLPFEKADDHFVIGTKGDIHVTYQFISRQHADIFWRNGEYIVKKHPKCSQRLFLNDQELIPGKEMPLKKNDLIHLGTVRFLVKKLKNIA